MRVVVLEATGLLSGSAAVAVETFLRPHPALSMSGSSQLVAVNTMALRWTRLPGSGGGSRSRWGAVNE